MHHRAHSFIVSTGEEVGKLDKCCPQGIPAAHDSRVNQRAAQCHCRGRGQDGLVKIEKGRDSGIAFQVLISAGQGWLWNFCVVIEDGHR